VTILIDVVFSINIIIAAVSGLLYGIYDIAEDYKNTKKRMLWQYMLWLGTIITAIFISMFFVAIPAILGLSLKSNDWGLLLPQVFILIFFISYGKYLYDTKVKHKVVKFIVADKKSFIYLLLGLIGGAIIASAILIIQEFLL